MNQAALLKPLLRSACLPELALALQESLAEEQARREKFHEEMDDSVKCEFINGEIIMHSPAKNHHLQTVKCLFRIIDAYVERHQLGTVVTEKALVRLPRNSYEPDICFFRQEVAGNFATDQMFFPAPDLAVEVLSTSTAKEDRGIKMEDYGAHGVREYWIVDPVKQTLEQYLMGTDNCFTLERKMSTGEVVSIAVPGLRFDVRAAFDPEVNRAVMRALWA